MTPQTMRDIRKNRKMSLMALATAAGSTPSWLTYIERYGHVPGPELRKRIAAALGVSEAELWPELALEAGDDGDE